MLIKVRVRGTSRSPAHSRIKPDSRWARSKSWLFALAIMTLCSGCCLPEAIRSTLQPYETLKLREQIKRRAKRQARSDWKSQYERGYATNPCATEIKQGFETAYEETALGMRGCPPPIPSRPMISKYSVTHTYPAAVPWYEGYSIGHGSAVAHGVDKWRLAPIDPQILLANANCRCEEHVHAQAVTLPVETEITPAEMNPELIPDAEGTVTEELPIPHWLGPPESE